MRVTLLILSCYAAAACLAVALHGPWAEADAADGSRYTVSLRKVSHVLEPRQAGSAHEDCDYLRAKGKVQLCAPAEYGDAPFSMLCSVFTLMLAALGLALASGTLAVVSPYRAKGLGAQLAGGSFIAALLGTILAQAAMPRALAIVEGLPIQFGGLPFSAVWCAIGLLLFAAGLSTTSTMLGHH